MPNLGIVVDADACIPERIRTDLGILSAPLHAPLLEGNETVMDLRHDADPPDPDAVAAACVRAAEESDTVLYVTVTDGNADNGASAARAAAAVGARARVVHYPSGDALMACGWQAIAAAVAARDTASAGHACEAAQEAARTRQREEYRRLLYVALTRAQRHITLFECLSRTRHGREKMCETSLFLREIPENLINKRIHAAKDMVEARVEPNKNQPKPRKTSRKAAKPRR